MRIARGALADNIPSRDLYLSPEHKLLLDGVLVAARDLLNGFTICQVTDEAVARIDYFHIELDTHECVLADGAWAEAVWTRMAARKHYAPKLSASMG